MYGRSYRRAGALFKGSVLRQPRQPKHKRALHCTRREAASIAVEPLRTQFGVLRIAVRSSAATSSRTVEGNGAAASIDGRRETDADTDAESDSSGNGDGGRNDSIDARCFDMATPMPILRSADGRLSPWAISPSAVNARRPLKGSAALAADVRTDR